jgi:hypothetical protein
LEGALAGLIFWLKEYYSFPADTLVPAIAPAITPKPQVRLHMTMLPEETQYAVKITWNGHDLWLKKSDIKIERKDDGIWLTIPAHLLEQRAKQGYWMHQLNQCSVPHLHIMMQIRTLT